MEDGIHHGKKRSLPHGEALSNVHTQCFDRQEGGEDNNLLLIVRGGQQPGQVDGLGREGRISADGKDALIYQQWMPRAEVVLDPPPGRSFDPLPPAPPHPADPLHKERAKHFPPWAALHQKV